MTKLQEIRKNSGRTQKEISMLSGINLRLYQYYEQGKNNIDGAKLSTLLKLSMALNCNICDIIEDEETVLLIKKKGAF